MKFTLFSLVFVSLITLSYCYYAKAVVTPKNGLCSLCEGLIEQVDEALKHGDDVEQAVANFCKNDVPSFLVDYCEKIVSKNLNFIIEALKNHCSPEKICTDLHLC